VQQAASESPWLTDGMTRYQHTATPLLDGKVLLAGGFHMEPAARGNTLAPPMSSVEIYDPGLRAWRPVASLQTPRARHAAVLLPDGRVLVLGGYFLDPLATAEIYDPQQDLWSPAPSLAMPRYDHAASLVAEQVIVTGGIYLNALSSVEVYSPWR
jgi:hypothetical protein